MPLRNLSSLIYATLGLFCPLGLSFLPTGHLSSFSSSSPLPSAAASPPTPTPASPPPPSSRTASSFSRALLLASSFSRALLLTSSFSRALPLPPHAVPFPPPLPPRALSKTGHVAAAERLIEELEPRLPLLLRHYTAEGGVVVVGAGGEEGVGEGQEARWRRTGVRKDAERRWEGSGARREEEGAGEGGGEEEAVRELGGGGEDGVGVGGEAAAEGSGEEEEKDER